MNIVKFPKCHRFTINTLRGVLLMMYGIVLLVSLISDSDHAFHDLSAFLLAFLASLSVTPIFVHYKAKG
jgi:hypothetical protein